MGGSDITWTILRRLTPPFMPFPWSKLPHWLHRSLKDKEDLSSPWLFPSLGWNQARMSNGSRCGNQRNSAAHITPPLGVFFVAKCYIRGSDYGTPVLKVENRTHPTFFNMKDSFPPVPQFKISISNMTIVCFGKIHGFGTRTGSSFRGTF